MEKLTIKEYIENISSNSPTPGGGNVSAFCGSLATSLAVMVTNLTIGKKKYSDVQDEIISLKTNIEHYINKFLDLAQKDNEAFNLVMSAFSLPKDSDSEKEFRKQKIEEATIVAAKVPQDVIINAYNLVDNFIKISEIGNQNSLSDIGVALLLLKTAAQGAYLNVLINISSLSDKNFAQSFINEINPIFNNLLNKIDNAYSQILSKLNV
ncbi:MAG TPA: cyclodeaminase/cyclohydrolase family protein [Ignavibacteriales bacterium]|nr:cyclodeaminase/cyclohydrolase family protein [Ignavibacteriales bacterium]